MPTLFPALALLAYLVATFAIVLRLFHPAGPNFKLVFGAATLAVVLHMLTLTDAIFTTEGQNFNLSNVSSLVCWLITLSITLTSLRTPAILLLPLVYTFAAVLLLTTLVVPSSVQIQHLQHSPGLIAHITLAFTAYVVLLMATLYSVQVAYISYKLKHKDFSGVSRFLPPLMQAENLQFRLLAAGTLLLALGLLSGIPYTTNWLEHKSLLSSLALGIFILLCWGHARLGWRGKTAITLTLTGTILLTLAYFGSRFVKEVLLNRF
ncbi:cytochrome C assembly family protein [Alishewanella tabrizica]|uniref:Cytochrome c assembly protein n=1 Tax=Alishewanella tabrizica TaxID=671278 RepID=A0ABQ2WUX8_9ALTE|nr:cytochrome c biogenesis protein CcsA [Alishewanella tabrizica]GGW71619.1 cytochrome c assembly protein [Alishewanella tabrizica]